MAQQKSILKLKGTIGGITFYKSKDGYLAREKGGVDASRIANDPGFVRTRENGAEFANAASAGKLLRDAVRVLGKNASDGRVTARLTQIMAQIKDMDDTNVRGERSAAEGMAKAEAKLLLKGFNFNINAVLSAVLYKPFQVDISTGVISFPAFNPVADLVIPSGASHVILQSAFAVVNFGTGESAISLSEALHIETRSAVQTVSLLPAEVPAMEGTKFILLCIDFVQSVNDDDYSLNNNLYNVLTIVEVI